MNESLTAVNECCHECGGNVTCRGYTYVQKVGRWTVTDGSSRAPQCEACGAPQLTLDELQGYQLRAVKTVLCEGHLDGEVIRYSRKALGLTQKELGKILDYTHETVSRWETGKEPMPRSTANALIGVLMRAIEGEDPHNMIATIEIGTGTSSPEELEVHVPTWRRVS